MDDWQVGDLALCIRDGWCPVRKQHTVITKGAVYTVQRVGRGIDDFGRTELILGLKGYSWKQGFNAIWFRKIRPHTPDAEDRETICLLNGTPVPVEA